MTLLRIYAISGAIVIAAASSVVMLGGRKKTPEQRETLRRNRISAEGRITDGTVLDVQELNSSTGQPLRMIMYTYDVAGVQYECSQDVTHLPQFPDVHSYQIGVTASVKYDPYHPGNSIVVAEDWCGLRT
jgi:hypothetical protein